MSELYKISPPQCSDKNDDYPICDSCGAKATHKIENNYSKWLLDEDGYCTEEVESWPGDDCYYVCENC